MEKKQWSLRAGNANCWPEFLHFAAGIIKNPRHCNIIINITERKRITYSTRVSEYWVYLCLQVCIKCKTLKNRNDIKEERKRIISKGVSYQKRLPWHLAENVLWRRTANPPRGCLGLFRDKKACFSKKQSTGAMTRRTPLSHFTYK